MRRPTKRQTERLLKLALLRDVCPNIPSTRAERFAAMTQLLGRISQEDAAVLIEQLQYAPNQRRWWERTPRFAREHALAVSRLGGEPFNDQDPQWHVVPRPSVPPAQGEDLEYAMQLAGKRKRYRVTADEAAAHCDRLSVREDEFFGEVCTSAW